MASLTAKTAFDGALPITIGDVTATEMVFESATSIAPLAGHTDVVSSSLRAQLGLGLPDPNRCEGDADCRTVWTGLDQVFVLGPRLSPIDGAAMTDQADAWAAFALEGPGARAVLARLTSVDLRADRFEVGHAARTQLGHMSAILMRVGDDRYDAMVFRSMTGTAVHDLERAMTAVAARENPGAAG